ncbi:TPA: EAL domain-containing protein [Citrobacter sedlakii]|nr:EAL domain-containing protein [Citrobacter sedlakii]
MNTKKIFLLSYDICLFSGIKSWLPNLVLVDVQSVTNERQQHLPQYQSCLLIIDNRLPLFFVNKWIQQNSSLFNHIHSIVLKMSKHDCFHRGYENVDTIDAKLGVNIVINALHKKALASHESTFSLENLSVAHFRLTHFEKEMLNASFSRGELNNFCVANAVSPKALYRYRDKINARLGFRCFNESVIFLSRNGLLNGFTDSPGNAQCLDYDELNASRLSMAIVEEEIIPYYQPIVNQNGDMCGVEILARWPQGHHYAISQKEFIPLAINSGLIFELTSYLMATVARDLISAKRIIKNELLIAFNIGPSGLSNPVFYWECLNFLEQTQHLPIKLMIEITEDQALNITPAIKELIRSLRNRGVLFALDDFGTGYANLYYLNELELDIIKIDKTFINNIKDGEQRVPMLESIIHLANILGLRTVAEGVEHEYQHRWLVNNHIHFLQGYYFLPPVPFADFLRYQRREESSWQYNVNQYGC